MVKKYIITVGTSLLQKNGLDYIAEIIKNSQADDDLTNQYALAKTYLNNLSENNLKNFSAEIATLNLINGIDKLNDHITLVSSSTQDGIFCANANCAYLVEKMGFKYVEIKTMPNSNITNSVEFVQKGLPNLMQILTNESKYFKTFICFTGGYKAIIPVLTLFALKNKIPLYYIFEPEDMTPELITIDINDEGLNITDKDNAVTSIPILITISTDTNE